MNKNNTNLIGKYVFSLFCIMVGGAIYVICDKNGYHGFVRNFVPDFLWMMAFMFALTPLFRFIFNKDEADFIAFVVCGSLGVIFEICQYIGIINGTGDYLDVITYFVAGSISRVLFSVKDMIRGLKGDKNG